MASHDLNLSFQLEHYSSSGDEMESRLMAVHRNRLGGLNHVTNNFQSLPSKVGSSQEAHLLIGKACKLRVEYQEKKAASLRRLQALLDEVKWFDDKILEVDVHIGKIYHVVDSSGFEIPPPIVAHREHTVVVEGGMY
jgi:hypothetical protein